MPFPESDRVIYAKDPLTEVICQVRFPPILRIETEAPAEFQERVRAGYPLFGEKKPGLSPDQIPPVIAKIIEAAQPARARATAYEFASEDQAWSITLSRDALALRTTAYARWEGFRDHLAEPLDTLNEIYRPSFFSRVGLRYINLIRRSTLGLNSSPWVELLTPHIAGEFSAAEIADQIEHALREVRVALGEDQVVMIRHGLAIEEQSDEKCFIIDSDFFTERRMEPGHAVATLNDFNRGAGCLFRWCIQDALHRAMEPTDLAE